VRAATIALKGRGKFSYVSGKNPKTTDNSDE
jgi:hypothetical protein